MSETQKQNVPDDLVCWKEYGFTSRRHATVKIVNKLLHCEPGIVLGLGVLCAQTS